MLSRSQLQQLESVDYRVTVTNTGKLTGSVAVLAFVKPRVRVPSQDGFVGMTSCSAVPHTGPRCSSEAAVWFPEGQTRSRTVGGALLCRLC